MKPDIRVELGTCRAINGTLKMAGHQVSYGLIGYVTRIEKDRGATRFFLAGCGDGACLEKVHDYTLPTDFLAGADIEAEPLLAARARVDREVELRVRDLTVQPLEMWDYDVVICHLVLNQIPPHLLKGFCENLAYGVKPGGCLAVSFVHSLYYGHLLKRDLGEMESVLLPSGTEWAYGELVIPEALLATGLMLEEVVDINSPCETPDTRASTTKEKLGIRQIRFMTLRRES